MPKIRKPETLPGLISIRPLTAAIGAEISGVTLAIHVLGTDDGHEYLRFDVFDREPHYHYLHPAQQVHRTSVGH